MDFQAHDGGSALMDAARKGRLSIVRLLLESGADPNLADKNGATASAMATEKGQAAVVALLAELGAH